MGRCSNGNARAGRCGTIIGRVDGRVAECVAIAIAIDIDIDIGSDGIDQFRATPGCDTHSCHGRIRNHRDAGATSAHGGRVTG